MNDRNSFISFKIFANFDVFTTKFSLNFRSIKIEIFLFRMKKIVVFFAKISNEKNFNENFRFRSHFRWMNEIFAKEIERKTLTGMQFSAEKMQEFKSTQF